MNIVALIPARAGSKRIPGKNIKLLGGKPLIQWTIEAAFESSVFQRIVVATDDAAAARITTDLGFKTYSRTPSADNEPDIAWVRDAPIGAAAFAILRPTSPFRTADTIRRAWTTFQNHPCDSLRAVEPAKQHPFKMWVLQHNTGRIVPFASVEWVLNGVPAHSCPTQTLPAIYAQNASLEIAWTKTLMQKHSISGDNILPFFTEGWEGFDINTPEDWERAERHATELLARLQATAAAQ